MWDRKRKREKKKSRIINMTRDFWVDYPILQRTPRRLSDGYLLECELNGRNLTINVGYEVINTSNRARQVKANLIACMYRSALAANGS